MNSHDQLSLFAWSPSSQAGADGLTHEGFDATVCVQTSPESCQARHDDGEACAITIDPPNNEPCLSAPVTLAEELNLPGITSSESSDIPAAAINAGRHAAPAPTNIGELIEVVREGRPVYLADALKEIEAGNFLSPDALRTVRSDLRVMSKTTQTPLDRLPCDPILLRPILNKVLPARHRMHLKRWSTIRSSAARCLKLTGWHAPDDVVKAKITGLWKEAVQRLPYGPQKATFGGFARYCLHRAITPHDVAEDHLENYRLWRLAWTLDPEVGHATSATRRHWKWLAKNFVDWPSLTLHAPRDRRNYAFAPELFAESFIRELDLLCTDMANPKPFDPLFNKSYSKHTISGVRNSLLRAASVLVHRRWIEAEAITDLGVILSPAAVRAVMEDHFHRVGAEGEWAASAVTLMCTLKRAAWQCGHFSDAELAELAAMGKMVRPPRPGLASRSREVVAQFDDNKVLLRFLELLRECFRAADQLLADGHRSRAARLSQRSLALAILQEKPLRRSTLAALDLARHFRRDGRGRVIGLSIPGKETKTGNDIEVLFSDGLADRITRHLEIFRPLLNPGDSTALFPSTKVAHLDPQTLARDLKRLVQGQIGIEFHVHVVRNLVATMLLDDDSRNGPVAQRMLDHATVKTTLRHYGQQRTRGAQREYAEMLERRLRELRRKGKK